MHNYVHLFIPRQYVILNVFYRHNPLWLIVKSFVSHIWFGNGRLKTQHSVHNTNSKILHSVHNTNSKMQTHYELGMKKFMRIIAFELVTNQSQLTNTN